MLPHWIQGAISVGASLSGLPTKRKTKQRGVAWKSSKTTTLVRRVTQPQTRDVPQRAHSGLSCLNIEWAYENRCTKIVNWMTTSFEYFYPILLAEVFFFLGNSVFLISLNCGQYLWALELGTLYLKVIFFVIIRCLKCYVILRLNRVPSESAL